MSERTPPTDANSTALLGCVADDVTGATDLSLNLVQGGMRVVQWFGVPDVEDLRRVEADAIVVALKSRSIQPAEAVDISLKALKTLHGVGCQRFYFKYCSTFDSTDTGNIGPVAEAMLHELGADQTIFCPAFPDAGRTVYAGHLFVNVCLLNESGMQNHPLNPMRDSCLVRVLAQQAEMEVDLLSYRDVAAGPDAITRKLSELRDRGQKLILTDALDETHLRNIAAACVDAPLVTGGSGLARYLPNAYRTRGILCSKPFTPQLPTVTGRRAILSGSCSRATLAQVAQQRTRSAARQINVAQLMDQPDAEFRDIFEWVGQQPTDATVMVYSTAEPEAVLAAQQRFGGESVAHQIETLQARIAMSLVDHFGVRQLIVAGGETSAAVAAALGVQALQIGPEIAPGVPWTESLGSRPLALAFKSGNFGDDNFFQAALEMLK